MSIDTQAYLFVHFIGEERNPTDEQLYFAPSGNRQRGHREIGIDDIAVIPRAGHSCHVGGSGIEIGDAPAHRRRNRQAAVVHRRIVVEFRRFRDLSRHHSRGRQPQGHSDSRPPAQDGRALAARPLDRHFGLRIYGLRGRAASRRGWRSAAQTLIMAYCDS